MFFIYIGKLVKILGLWDKYISTDLEYLNDSIGPLLDGVWDRIHDRVVAVNDYSIQVELDS